MRTPLKRPSSPEFNQDLPFQRRTWRIQRIGWGVIALILLGAFLGMFGHGPLSETTADDPSIPLSLDYERFGRYQRAQTLHVHVRKDAVPEGTVAIWISHEYLRNVVIEQFMPKPDSAYTSPTGMTYVFRVAQPDQPADIIVSLQMQAVGVLSGQIGLDKSHALHFWQLIYP